MADQPLDPDVLKRIGLQLFKAVIGASPSASVVHDLVQRNVNLSTKNQAIVAATIAGVIADSLAAEIPMIGVLVPLSTLIAKVISDNPSVLENLSNSRVHAATSEFVIKIQSSSGDLAREKEIIDEGISSALTLPNSLKAAAVIIMLGACGGATWDGTQYLFEQSYDAVYAEEIIPSPEKTQIIANGEDAVGLTVSVDGLRLRAEPSLDGSIVGTLQAGTKVSRLFEDGDWFAVSIEDGVNLGRLGWVHKDYVTE